MEAPNEIDVMMRQAVLYEYVKENEADKEQKRSEEIVLLILAVLLASGLDFTKRVTKTQLNALLKTLGEKLRKAIATHDEELVASLKEVMKAVTEVTKSNMAFLTGKKLTAETLFSASTVSNNKLWLKLSKDIMPGTGLPMTDLIKGFGASVINEASKLIRQSFVEKLSIQDITARIRGTAKKGFKDGLLNKLGNQARTLTRTIGTGINSFINNNLGPLFYDRYQWVSTIDQATTDICRSRHMRIFRYGNGPVPPAHYNCRSIIVGMVGDLANQYGSNFFSWLANQPQSVLADLLSEAEARDFRNGNAKADAYRNLRANKRLTPTQFGKKLSTMQKGSDNA